MEKKWRYFSGVNHVLVKPDDDHLIDEMGLDYRGLGNKQKHWSTTGVVVDAPKWCIAPDKVIRKLMKIKNAVSVWKARHKSLSALPTTDCPRLAPGDKVMFMFAAKFDAPVVDGMIVIPYELLVARMNPFLGLNGYVIISMLERDEEESQFQEVYYDRNEYGIGVTLSESVGKIRNRDDDRIAGPVPSNAVVTFRKRDAARIDLPMHDDKNDGRSLFFLKRVNILTWKV